MPGIGDETGDPQAFAVGERELRPGVWSFLAQDQPGTGRPHR